MTRPRPRNLALWHRVWPVPSLRVQIRDLRGLVAPFFRLRACVSDAHCSTLHGDPKAGPPHSPKAQWGRELATGRSHAVGALGGQGLPHEGFLEYSCLTMIFTTPSSSHRQALDERRDTRNPQHRVWKALKFAETGAKAKSGTLAARHLGPTICLVTSGVVSRGLSHEGSLSWLSYRRPLL